MEADREQRNDWGARAKNLLKGQLKYRGVSYAQLAEALARIGIEENERNIANKLSRGTFSAAFLLQCLKAIGVSRLELPD
jgi:3-mercaptopyruvate sulfurtransferase SseA